MAGNVTVTRVWSALIFVGGVMGSAAIASSGKLWSQNSQAPPPVVLLKHGIASVRSVMVSPVVPSFDASAT
eukprot:COSAG05_NODE_1926_length_3825_cov_1.854804_2_plen_71_part_00